MKKLVLTAEASRTAVAEYLKAYPLADQTVGMRRPVEKAQLADETVGDAFTLLTFLMWSPVNVQHMYLSALLAQEGNNTTVNLLALSGKAEDYYDCEKDLLELAEHALYDYGFPVERPQRFAPPPTMPVGKFEYNFRDYTPRQLQQVIDGKSYVPGAKRAAKNLLYRMQYSE